MGINVIEKGIYKHLKGEEYTVLAVADDSKCNTYIVYLDKKGQVFARPASMFTEKINKVNYPGAKQERRFEYTGKVAKRLPKHNTDNIIHTEEDDILFKMKYRSGSSRAVLVKVK